MRVTRLGRILGAVGLAAAFVVTVTGPSSASKPAGWHMDVQNLPDMVGSNGALGYRVTITNDGPSNVSQLYLYTGTQQVPAYVVPPAGTSCPGTPSGALLCSLGPLNVTKGRSSSVTVIVAYAHAFTDTDAPGDAEFTANTTGVSGSDDGTSHGDNLYPPTSYVPTVVTDSPDFAGGFSLGGEAISTDTDLSATNQQSTTVQPPAAAAHSVVTAQDSGVSFTCKKVCGKAFGEWSSVNVGGGQTFDTYFPVTLTVPVGIAPTNLSKIVMAHVDAVTGAVQVLGQCSAGASKQDCIDVSSDGVSLTMTAWVDHNGGFKGMG